MNSTPGTDRPTMSAEDRIDRVPPWTDYTPVEAAAVASVLAHTALGNLTVRHSGRGALADALMETLVPAAERMMMACAELGHEWRQQQVVVDPNFPRKWAELHASVAYAAMLPQLLRVDDRPNL